MKLRAKKKTVFHDNFAISHSGNDRPVCEDCFIYFLFIETTVRNTTPSWQPPHIYDSLLCEDYSLAKSQKHLLLTQRCILGSIVKKEKKRKKKRPSFIMELRNCKLSKYNGRTLGPRARLYFACATGSLQCGLNIELRATKVTPIWTRHLTRRSSRDVRKYHLKEQEQYRLCCACIRKDRKHCTLQDIFKLLSEKGSRHAH